MYLPIGADFSVRTRCIIGIFDLDNTSTSKFTRKFLSQAEKMGEIIDISGSLPKSYIITEEFGMRKIYLTQFNAASLEKRLQKQR